MCSSDLYVTTVCNLPYATLLRWHEVFGRTLQRTPNLALRVSRVTKRCPRRGAESAAASTAAAMSVYAPRCAGRSPRRRPYVLAIISTTFPRPGGQHALARAASSSSAALARPAQPDLLHLVSPQARVGKKVVPIDLPTRDCRGLDESAVRF